MSNPTVSFRISDYQLARGLRAIRAIEPAWQITTASDLIRTVFIDYIAKSELQHNSPLDVTPELLQEIAQARAGLAPKPIPAPKPLGTAPPVQQNVSDIVTAVMQAMGQTTEQTTVPALPIQAVDTRTPERKMRDEQDQQIWDEVQTQAQTHAQTDMPTQPDFDKQIELALQEQQADAPDESLTETPNHHINLADHPASVHDKSTEYETDSDITTVTDFSPPPDWKE